MQLLHSVYDLQVAAGTAESQYVLKLSNEFVNDRLSDESEQYTPHPLATEGDLAFVSLWNKITSFRKFSYLTEEQQSYLRQQLPAPVLTRWHTVGIAAEVVDRLYLQLVKATQIYVNSNDTKSRTNKIAAGLQSLMAEPLIYSDLQLVKCFHKSFLQDHFEWLQASDDMSSVPGFQSHQVLPRFFLMRKDLLYINDTINSSHPGFEDYRSSLEILTENERQQQQHKVLLFFQEAINALIKHFARWAYVPLLPAALLSETPLADCVARVMLATTDGIPVPPAPTSFFASQVHSRLFNIKVYQSFLIGLVSLDYDADGDVYHPNELIAAQMRLNRDIDLRNKDLLQDPHDVSTVKLFLFHSYLPLAHQTQFVEAGVKLAKLASSTGRSEESRSSYATVKSSTDTVVSAADNRTDKSARWIAQAGTHVQLVKQLKETDPMAYSQGYNRTKRSLKLDHFKQERVAAKRAKVSSSAETNKKRGKLQKIAGADVQYLVLCLVPLGRLRTHHLQAVRTELDMRSVAYGEKDGIRKLSDLLHKHELSRVKGDAVATKHAKDKAFKPLSDADFTVEY